MQCVQDVANRWLQVSNLMWFDVKFKSNENTVALLLELCIYLALFLLLKLN